MSGQHEVARPGMSPADQQNADSRIVIHAVGRAQRGDRDALGFLYARYADDVCAYALSIVRHHHDAEDVTQQVFAKLLSVLGKYQRRDVPFRAWVLRVAHNVAVDHVRGRRAIPVEEVRARDERDWSSAGSEHVSDLTEALLTLPRAQREVLVLRHVAGLSPGEIALRTGRTESSIHGLHHRGRRALTAELAVRGAAPSTAVPQRVSGAGF